MRSAATIPIDHRACGIDHDDGILGRVAHGPKALFAISQQHPATAPARPGADALRQGSQRVELHGCPFPRHLAIINADVSPILSGDHDRDQQTGHIVHAPHEFADFARHSREASVITGLPCNKGAIHAASSGESGATLD
jgi:hypothetical protein